MRTYSTYTASVIPGVGTSGYAISLGPAQTTQLADGQAAGADPDDTDPESEDEAFVRRRTSVKPLDLGEPPTAGGLRTWINDLYVRACASSNRSEARTMKYIKAVESAKSIESLSTVRKHWDAFDTELASGVMKISKGATKKELILYQETQAKACLPMSGRAALWIFLNRYHIDKGQALQVDLAGLLALEYKGDLEAYLDLLDAKLLNLQKHPDEEMLHAIVEPQLRKCKALAPEFVTYDRAKPDALERTTAWLYEAARGCVARKRKEDNLAALQNAPKSVVVKNKPDQLPKDCIAFSKTGKCKFGDKCWHRHDTKSTTAPHPKSKAKADAKTKADSKKERSKKKSPSEIPCRYFHKGTCKAGASCKFKHDPAVAPADSAPAAVTAMICRPGSYFTEEEFVLDTGSGLDVGKTGLPGKRKALDSLPRVNTTGGMVEPETTVTTHINGVLTCLSQNYPPLPNALIFWRVKKMSKTPSSHFH